MALLILPAVKRKPERCFPDIKCMSWRRSLKGGSTCLALTGLFLRNNCSSQKRKSRSGFKTEEISKNGRKKQMVMLGQSTIHWLQILCSLYHCYTVSEIHRCWVFKKALHLTILSRKSFPKDFSPSKLWHRIPWWTTATTSCLLIKFSQWCNKNTRCLWRVFLL